MDVEKFRARWMELEFLGYSDTEEDVALLRYIDGTDVSIPGEFFREFYVPVLATTAEFAEGMVE